MRRTAVRLLAHVPCSPASLGALGGRFLGTSAAADALGSGPSTSGRELGSGPSWASHTRFSTSSAAPHASSSACPAALFGPRGAAPPFLSASVPHGQLLHGQDASSHQTRQFGSVPKRGKAAGKRPNSSSGQAALDAADDVVAPAVKGGKQKGGAAAAEATAPSARQAAAATAAVPAPGTAKSGDDASLFHTNRYRMFYERIMFRELMLKGNGRDFGVQPRPASLTLTILVADTRLTGVKDTVDKEDMLLHLLALEHVTGQPAGFVSAGSSHQSNKAAGVTVTLTGTAMFTLLERIVYVVLPAMTGFEGAPPPQRDRSPGAARRKGPAWVINVKVPSILLFPDFDQNFELFEPLRSVQMQLVIADASSAQSAALLAQGMGVPMSTAVVPKAA